jgi:hypothetical protein
MSTDRQILLIGLPGTGKTSFLAALWYMVNQTTEDCALTLDRLDGDSAHLDRIRHSWLEYEPVSRTLLDSEKMVSMRLKNRETGDGVRLTFPDLSGESFRLQWTARQFTKGYDKLLRQADGAMLFVHPSSIVKPNRIDMADVLVAAQQGSEKTDGAAAAGEGFGSPWEIEKAATQVQLIDLLQFIAARDYFRPPLKVSIVVSAWDLLLPLDTTPVDWISGQLPMLFQFLESNRRLFEPSFYGLSAQGIQYPSWRFAVGDIKDEKAFAKRLSDKVDPVSAWLWGQFEEPIQTALQSRLTEATDSADLQRNLVDKINRVISSSVIFEPDRFKEVRLRRETEELTSAKDVKKGDETVRVNRLLLEDAYPLEISRERQSGPEMTALQQRLPARRISLVGPNPGISHDITEPVQWLMH